MVSVSVWLCLLAGALAFDPPAQADVFHRYESQITEIPANPGVEVPGPVIFPEAMTVDALGDLYVAEDLDGTVASTNARADQFAPSSLAPVSYEFVSQLPQSSPLPEQYLGGEAGTTVVNHATSAGNWASGDVFVLKENVVHVFTPEADGKSPSNVEEAQITGISPTEPFTAPEEIAVSGFNGDLLVQDGRSVALFKPEEEGTSRKYTFVRDLVPPGGASVIEAVAGLAVDGGNGEIYFATYSAVYEFGPEGTFRGQITAAETPQHKWLFGRHTLESVAVDPVSHRVFVGVFNSGEIAGDIDVFGPDIIVPHVVTGPATNLRTEPSGAEVEPATHTWEAQLNGMVNPENAGAGTCQFEWGVTTEFGSLAGCSAPVPQGAGEVAVQASLSGLEPDTTYYYRLQATNANGTNPGEASQDQQFTTPGPGLHGDAPADVTAESGTLTATLNPHGAPTTYYFQYGTSASYGGDAPVLSEAAEDGGTVGSGEGDVEVSQHIQGLQPDTVYHFRVVAVSELNGQLEAFASPDQTFTTEHATPTLTLPDGRQWEMVTPPKKYGADFLTVSEGTLIQASANGDAIADLATSPIEASPLGNTSVVTVLSTRGSGGWSSQSIVPPHKEATGLGIGNGHEYRFFSEDLSLGVLQPFGSFTELSPQASESTAYLRTDYLNGDVSDHCESSPTSESSCFQPLVTAANTPPGTKFGEELNGGCGIRCGPQFVDASPDASHVVLESPASLTEGSTGGLYEWAGGTLTFIGEGQLGYQDKTARHAISDDGSHVVFDGVSEGLEGLLMRDTVTGKTSRIDASQGGKESFGPRFMIASSDGSRIFFLDSRGLTAEASEGGADLYEYDLNAPSGRRLTDLTVDKRFEEDAEVAEVLGASEDGSYVYFAASGVLAPGAQPGECSANNNPQASCNLYVRHDGTTTLIAALSREDAPDWSGELDHMTARVSPNGNWLAFMSNRDLTGYDTNDAVSGHPDEEVYLYDASTSHLICASCSPTGARPVGVEYEKLNDQLVGGDRIFEYTTWIAANVPGWTPYTSGAALYQSRYLSDSGRLFFNSNDALAPQDVNGTEDVYEYEPAGVGSCTEAGETFSEHAGGCVGLISSGSSPAESAFLDASETGGDVFFLTKAKLAPEDFDTSLDVYDAHECTTQAPCFPVAPVVAPPCETGDACKPAPTPQPSIFGAPSSATFSGAGNIASAAVKPAVKRKPLARAKPLTRAKKLARALSTCKKKRRRKQRNVCERKARIKYGAKKSGKKSAKVNAKRGGR